MKSRHSIHALWAIALAGLPWAAHAQTNFNSGSNGSFGAINIAANQSQTIQLPADGVLHCTTVVVQTNATLKFTPNVTNTPVYILATGDVNISGYVLVEGRHTSDQRGAAGGPGGFPGGQGGANPSNGYGPGAGKGGWFPGTGPTGQLPRGGGGFGTVGLPAASGGSVYSNSLLIPLVGGSGGGGGDAEEPGHRSGGGGGGGAILIASNTKINMSTVNLGFIDARGGGNNIGVGGGSGGAVRLVAPTIEGTADIRVPGAAGGGFGRIRIDALTNTMQFNDQTGSAPYATFGANMVVFPANPPELRVTQAAGTDIALTQTDPVFVLLPAGAPATQTVQVQAKNFNSVVPLMAVVTPEAGERQTFNFEVDNTAGGATIGSVQVQIPAGVSTCIDVWTR